FKVHFNICVGFANFQSSFGSILCSGFILASSSVSQFFNPHSEVFSIMLKTTFTMVD
ncbi:hypothetical protein FRX31_027018, partial [Thalictrum thalictroides]